MQYFTGVKHVLQVIVAEDNEVLRKEIINLISKIDEFEIIYSTDNGRDLFNALKKNRPDVVITDIDMPGMNGIEAVKTVRAEMPDTEIVFISAYDMFLRQAVHLYAFDFIEKPLDSARFIETLERIKRRRLTTDKMIEFKTHGSLTLIKASDLYFVEASKKNTNVFSENGEFTSTYSLKEFEKLLIEEFFFKSSRSYIVNLKKVRGIKPISRTSFEINFDKDEWKAYLSKNRYDEFRSKLKKFFY